ncbi:hypothetical protein GGI11_008228, partial [Coemansia sp. RSA 2049]
KIIMPWRLFRISASGSGPLPDLIAPSDQQNHLRFPPPPTPLGSQLSGPCVQLHDDDHNNNINIINININIFLMITYHPLCLQLTAIISYH